MCPKNQSATDVKTRLGLNSLQTRLLDQARKRCGADIEPCAGCNWEESFTTERGVLMLWYNDAHGNTHVEREGGERAQS